MHLDSGTHGLNAGVLVGNVSQLLHEKLLEVGHLLIDLPPLLILPSVQLLALCGLLPPLLLQLLWGMIITVEGFK